MQGDVALKGDGGKGGVRVVAWSFFVEQPMKTSTRRMVGK